MFKLRKKLAFYGLPCFAPVFHLRFKTICCRLTFAIFPRFGFILRTLFHLAGVGSLCTLSLNSCHHVVANSSARGERARFRVRVTLGVILTRSLVNTKHIPGRLRSDSGVALE